MNHSMFKGGGSSKLLVINFAPPAIDSIRIHSKMLLMHKSLREELTKPGVDIPILAHSSLDSGSANLLVWKWHFIHHLFPLFTKDC